MSRSSARRALRCPTPGCSGWALLPTDDESPAEAPAWTCANGHRGPHVAAVAA